MSNLRQKLYPSNAKVETTTIENTELALKLETIESEFTAKVDELQEKIHSLITEVDLTRHERYILEALKCQLDLQKKVLEQTGPREIFFYDEKPLQVECRRSCDKFSELALTNTWIINSNTICMILFLVQAIPPH